MTAYSLTFKHIEEPDPINVPTWLVYGVLGTSAVVGVICALGYAAAKVEDMPFCERRSDFMMRRALWRIAPPYVREDIEAFTRLDPRAIAAVPSCSFSRNYAPIDL